MGTPSRRALARAGEVLNRDVQDLRLRRGYLDLFADDEPKRDGLAQLLMRSRVVPVIYERWWRPALGSILKGFGGPSMAQEVRLARQLLALEHGTTVLDIACGPGNFSRRFAADVGERGTVIGIDISASMLARAVTETQALQVVYVRADATDLPVRDGSVEAVCCFAALHLFSDPWAALDVMARALVPRGRLALLTTSRPKSLPGGLVAGVVGRTGGMGMFGADELVRGLTARGLEVTYHRTFGLMQIVGARRSPNGR